MTLLRTTQAWYTSLGVGSKIYTFYTYITSMEEWKEIPGYAPYEVSSLGRVRRGEKVLKPGTNLDGYLYVSLYRKSISVHRLVALTFIPRIEGRDTVDHINQNKLDNKIANLRWANRSEQLINRPYSNVSGERNINFDNTNYHHLAYRVQIKRYGIYVLSKRFATLPEAIAARDAFLMSSSNPQP